MKVETWGTFWKQVKNKKKVFEMNRSTFFHYVVLEFLGHSPNYKLKREEKAYIREMHKGSNEYEDLFKLYQDRMEYYAVSEGRREA